MTATIIPTMRYDDAPKMINWLRDTFGFTRHLVIDDGEGGIAHAQLTRDGAMIMLGSARDDAFGRLQGTARKAPRATQCAYIIVDDVDLICEAARAEGADIVFEPKDEGYGGRGFTCRGPIEPGGTCGSEEQKGGLFGAASDNLIGIRLSRKAYGGRP